MKPLTPDDYRIYDKLDDFPPWKRRAFNALAWAMGIGFLALVGAALWALWTHLWLVPVIVVPLMAWAFASWITHP